MLIDFLQESSKWMPNFWIYKTKKL